MSVLLDCVSNGLAGQLAGLGVKAKPFLIFMRHKADPNLNNPPPFQKLTVLQVVPELGTGGAERTTIEVAQAIVQAGGRALVWSSGGRLLPELEAVGAIHITGPAASKNPWTVFVTNPARLKSIIEREKVNMVHARSRAPAWSALIAARRAKVAFVTTYHGIYNAKTAIKRWYNSVMVRGDAIIANSNYTKAHLIEQHGTSSEKVTVIYRGVDVDGFDPAAVSADRRAALLEKWNLYEPREHLRIILPARLTEWKGQRVLIAALAKLKIQGLKFEAILVGDSQGRDAYVGELHAQIAQAGLEDQVFLVGHCSDMPAAFSLCDIAVTPSTAAEAFGRTAAEAQAMGLPVIASDLGGARETVDPDVTGYLSAPSDIDALAGHLATLIHMTPEARRTMGAAGYARIRALFTTQSLQTRTLALYQSVMAECHGE
jgi:glycosyltransferase involved in cell wall biosynthesis